MRKTLLRRPEAQLILTFAGLALIGTVVLCLPVCHASDKVTVLDALFTATSAVCVTGLITLDTEHDFSRTGQAVILVLMQLGGLGVMTFGAVGFHLLRRRVSFGSQAALQDVVFQGEFRGGLADSLRKILLLTFVIEFTGAVLIYIGLRNIGARHSDWFDAVFMSVSGFCNSGFSVFNDSAMGLRDSPLIVWTLMGLIVVGGLGYTVLLEIAQRGRRWVRRERGAPVNWSLHAMIVFVVSGGLIVFGAVALAITGLTGSEDTWGEYLIGALFQSVSGRTAGFNTVDISALPVASLMVLIPLMFIGGGPGSCAGGVKVTTATVWVLHMVARAAGRTSVEIGRRRVPPDVVQRAALVIGVSALWCLVGIFLLSLTEPVGESMRFEQIIFEQVSAFATVGMSTGITPDLSPLGKLWIIASMFVGRVGPLSAALIVLTSRGRPKFEYPQERVMIG